MKDGKTHVLGKRDKKSSVRERGILRHIRDYTQRLTGKRKLEAKREDPGNGLLYRFLSGRQARLYRFLFLTVDQGFAHRNAGEFALEFSGTGFRNEKLVGSIKPIV